MEAHDSRGVDRRSFLTGVGITSIAALWPRGTEGSAIEGSDSLSDWSMPRYDQNRSGTVPIDTESDSLTANWRTSRPGTGVLYYGGESAPVVHDGTVYDIFGDRLVSIDAESGTTRWSKSVEESIVSGPVCHSNRVFIATDTHVITFSTDGELLWSRGVTSTWRNTMLAPTEEGLLFQSHSEMRLFDYEGDEQWSETRSSHLDVAVDGLRAYVLVESDQYDTQRQLQEIYLESGIVGTTVPLQQPYDRIVVTDGTVYCIVGEPEGARIAASDIDSILDGLDPVYEEPSRELLDVVVGTDSLFVLTERYTTRGGFTGGKTMYRLTKIGLAGIERETLSLPPSHQVGQKITATDRHVYVATEVGLLVVETADLTIRSSVRSAYQGENISPPAIVRHERESGSTETRLFVSNVSGLASISHDSSGQETIYVDPEVEWYGPTMQVGSSLPSLVGLGAGAIATGPVGGLSGVLSRAVYGSTGSTNEGNQGDTSGENGSIRRLLRPSLPTMGTFLLVSWLVMSGLILAATGLRQDPNLLVDFELAFDPRGAVLFWKFAGAFTTILAFLNGAVGAVVLARTFGCSSGTEKFLAALTVLAGLTGLVTVQWTHLHLVLGYRYEPILLGATIVVPWLLVVVGFLVRYLWAVESSRYTWFLLALIGPFYLPAHVIAMHWMTVDFQIPLTYFQSPLSVVLLGHGVTLGASLLGLLAVVSYAVTGEKAPSVTDNDDEDTDGDDGGEDDDSDDGGKDDDSDDEREDDERSNDEATAQNDQSETTPEPGQVESSPATNQPIRDDAFGGTAPGVLSTRKQSGSSGVLERYRGEIETRTEPVEIHTVGETTQPAVQDAFSRRAQVWRSLGGQQNVVEVYRVEDEPRPWIAHESLEDFEEFAVVASDLSVADVCHVVDGVAEALRVASLYNHNHHNLDPRHVWLDLDGPNLRCKVGDWGIEAAIDRAIGEWRPTAFTAPEQLDDRAAVDLRTDIYALGALAYYGATGTHPYVGASSRREAIESEPFAVANDMDAVPAVLREPIRRATAPDPGERYSTIASLQGAFRELL